MYEWGYLSMDTVVHRRKTIDCHGGHVSTVTWGTITERWSVPNLWVLSIEIKGQVPREASYQCNWCLPWNEIVCFWSVATEEAALWESDLVCKCGHISVPEDWKLIGTTRMGWDYDSVMRNRDFTLLGWSFWSFFSRAATGVASSRLFPQSRLASTAVALYPLLYKVDW